MLADKSICHQNRQLWEAFFEKQERKLKRINNLPRLDDAAYKTLGFYLTAFNNVNNWFAGKPWEQLAKEDIQKVYDDLEDGVIKNRFGKRFVDRKSYYTKIFKSMPFKMAGKADFAAEVFEFYRPVDNSVVNYIEFDDFLKITSATKTVHQKLLLWLSWDIGENVGSLLQLKKSDFRYQLNPHTGQPEYLIELRKDILKRSRRARVEITNFTQTAELLDIVLADIDDGGFIFNFAHRQALKFLAQCVEAAGVKCTPTGRMPTYKDLRNSMCCYLLKIGWRIEEVNSRLGHSPANLAMVTRYANYLALDRHKPKLKVTENHIEAMKQKIDNYQQTERLQSLRLNEQEIKIARLEQSNQKTAELVAELIKKIADIQNGVRISLSQAACASTEICPGY